MLSMKSSTSWRSTSLKYSAMVSADSPTLEPHTGWLVHLAEDQRRLVDDPRLGHLEEEVVLCGSAPHPGEHGHLWYFPATRRIISWMITVLPVPAPPNISILPLMGRLEQVDHLDPGDEDLLLRLDLVERGRLAVDRPTLLHLDRVGGYVERLAPDVEDVAQGDRPTGTEIG